jgi:holo-[acyl-carrier protein] synthase
VIIGIGVDLIELQSWHHFLSQYFDEFCCQCFSSDELDRIKRSKDPFLAAGIYFAIKEAVLKAIGIGLKEGVAWVDIEVLRLSTHPEICVRAVCREHAQRLGIREFLVETAVSRNKTILATAIASDGA